MGSNARIPTAVMVMFLAMGCGGGGAASGGTSGTGASGGFESDGSVGGTSAGGTSSGGASSGGTSAGGTSAGGSSGSAGAGGTATGGTSSGGTGTGGSGAGGTGAGGTGSGGTGTGGSGAGGAGTGGSGAGGTGSGGTGTGGSGAGGTGAGGAGGAGGSGGAGTLAAWHHVFDLKGESSLTDVTELPSADLVAVGAVSSFGAGSADGLVARFSASGAYLWSRAIGSAETDRLDAVVGDGSGGVVVVGHSEYSSRVSFVARFDASGNLVFSNNLVAPKVGLFWNSNLTLTDVVRMGDGNFALIGQHEDDDTTTGISGQFRGWIGVMTPTGTLVKQRRFGSSSAYLGFYEGAVLPGGDLVVVGWWDESALVMRLDSTLHVKWRSTQPSAYKDYGADFLSILPLPSGDLIVGGRYFEADFSSTVSHWFLQRITGAGVGVWTRRLEHKFSGVTGLFARGSNEFVALGYAPNGGDANAYAAILDNNGFVLSQHSLGLTGTDWLSEGVVSSDGSLVVAGYDGGTPYGSLRIARIKNTVPTCDPAAGDQLASVTYAPPPAPDTSDFGDSYTVTMSSSGPSVANGPASSSPKSVCGP